MSGPPENRVRMRGRHLPTRPNVSHSCVVFSIYLVPCDEGRCSLFNFLHLPAESDQLPRDLLPVIGPTMFAWWNIPLCADSGIPPDSLGLRAVF